MRRSLPILIALLVACAAPAPMATPIPSPTFTPEPACTPPPITRTPEAKGFNDLSEWLPHGVSILVPADHHLGRRQAGDQGYVEMALRAGGPFRREVKLFWYPPMELDEGLVMQMIDAVWFSDLEREIVEIEKGEFKCLPAYFVRMKWSGFDSSGAAESTIVQASDAIYHLLIIADDPISQLYLDIRDSLQIE